MIEVRIKYTEQDLEAARSMGKMSFTDARALWEAFEYSGVVERFKHWLNLETVTPPFGPAFEIQLPKDEGAEEYAAEHGHSLPFGFIYSALIVQDGEEPYLLYEYMEVV